MSPQHPIHAPAATVLIGLIAGLLIARHAEVPPWILLSFALFFILIACILSCKKTGTLSWTFTFITGTTLCFWAYGNICLIPKPSELDLNLPEREATISLKVRKVLHVNEPYNSASVIARVLQGPKIGRLCSGDLIYAQLKLPETLSGSEPQSVVLQKGLQIRTTGLLISIPESSETQPDNYFDRYLKNIGIHYRFDRTHELELLKLPTAFVQFCASMEERFQTILQMGAPEDSELANIYVTMLLGKNAVLSDEQRERYQTTGTMHFFAISGLHIGIIAAVIAQCLLLLRIPRNYGPWIGLPLLYLYVEITGAAPSAMRAFLMTAFFWASFVFRRQHSSFTALVNSAVVVLLIDPYQLWNLGFQLSYTVVASIVLFGLPLGQQLKQQLQPYRWLPEDDLKIYQRWIIASLDKLLPLFAIGLAAWLASVPLCAAYFNFIAPGAIILNMLLVCLVAITIICGILSMVCGALLSLTVSTFINHAAWITLSAMDGIVRLGTFMPIVTFQNKGYHSEICYAVLFAYFLSLFRLHVQSGKIENRQFYLPVVILLGSMSLFLIY